jgi:xylulokinase
MTFLGIDVGVSAVKAVLVDEDETVRAEADVAVALSVPEAGAAEQDPEGWWAATTVAIDDVRRMDPHGVAAIRGIGLTGQMHAAVLLDETDQVIRPAMTWNDVRAATAALLLERQVPDVETLAGAVPMPGFTAAKLLWLREHEPESFARIDCVLSAKDYIRLRLTGERATDVSEAAGMLLLAEEQRNWSGSLVAASGITHAALPELLEGPAWSGMMLPDLRAAWGIDHPVVVPAGAGDICSAAIGVGTIRDGDAMVAVGDTARLFVARESYHHQPGSTLQTFAQPLPGRWFETNAPINGVLCLDWLTGIVGEADVSRLIGRAQETFAGPAPLLFLPYGAGDRPPLSDPSARGAFAGADATHGQRDMTQAILDGVAQSLRDAEEAFGGRFPGGAIPMVGAGAKSALWLLVLASVLDRPLLRVSNADIAAAFGAARLARMAATGASAETIAVQPPLIEIIDPVPDLQAAYAERRGDFLAFARSLRQTSEAPAAREGRRRLGRR